VDGEEIGGRGDRGGADPEVAEYRWGGDIELDGAVDPSPAAGCRVLRCAQAGYRLSCLAALPAGLQLVGGVEGDVEGDHFGVMQRSGDLMHGSGQDAHLGGRTDRDDRAIRAVPPVWLADPDQDLGVRQVARIGSGLVGGRADDGRRGDPQGEADRGQGRPGAGLVPGEVAQRQPHRDRRPSAQRGERPDGQRADQQDPQRHRQRAGDDQRGAGLVGQAEADDASHDHQGGHQGRAMRGPGPRRPGRQGEHDR